MSRTAITATGAAAIGPYSHAIRAGNTLYCSGQTPIDPATNRLVHGDIAAQTHQCLANLGAVLAATGLGPADVVKCNVYLVDMADFPAMNAAYAQHFAEPYPARTTVAVDALPLGARIEIEMIATIPTP